jgi:hypothetical protein
MAKTKNKLWCVSFKHDEMESETIYHVDALTRSKAENIATAEFIRCNEIYSDDDELFENELASGDLDIIAFEVKKSEILK